MMNTSMVTLEAKSQNKLLIGQIDKHDKYEIHWSAKLHALTIMLSVLLFQRDQVWQSSGAHLMEGTWMGHCCLDQRGWRCRVIWLVCQRGFTMCSITLLMAKLQVNASIPKTRFTVSSWEHFLSFTHWLLEADGTSLHSSLHSSSS